MSKLPADDTKTRAGKVKIRESKGFAFAVRGDEFFVRITVAPQDRVNARARRATTLGEATARAHAVQALVNRLRRADKAGYISEKLIKDAAAADDAELARIVETFDAVIGRDDFEKLAPKTTSNVVTFESFAMRWVKGELADEYPDYVERKRSAYVDQCNLRKYVFPLVGSKAIAAVTLEDFEQVMREADRRTRTKKLARSTRRQIAQVMRRVLGLAAYPAKLIKVNPIPDNAMPSKGTDVSLQFCYPEEDALLMADERADLGHRLLFGFMHRQGPRRAEVLGGKADIVDESVEDDDTFGDVPALTWGRVDLKRGAILPERNKTGDTSLTPIEPDLVRALTAWKAMCTKTKADDPVFVTLDGAPVPPHDAKEVYCSTLRAALVAKDCDRPELWTAKRGQRALRLHDARASFVTVALVNGRSEDWVRRRSKHKSSAIERYRRQMGTYAELKLGDWVPLDQAIPEIAKALKEADALANASAERVSTDGERSRTSSEPPQIPHVSAAAMAVFDPGGLGVGGSNPLAPTGSETLGTIRFSEVTGGGGQGETGGVADTFADRNVSAKLPALPEHPPTSDRSDAVTDAVDAALAAGISAIAASMGNAAPGDLVALAERMSVLARELEARRTARAGNVIALAARRKR